MSIIVALGIWCTQPSQVLCRRRGRPSHGPSGDFFPSFLGHPCAVQAVDSTKTIGILAALDTTFPSAKKAQESQIQYKNIWGLGVPQENGGQYKNV